MSKFGRLIPFEHQLCLAHGIHLAVIDVLYKQNMRRVANTSAEVEDDSSDLENDADEENEKIDEIPIIDGNYGLIVDKVRNIVRMFRKSPTRNQVRQFSCFPIIQKVNYTQYILHSA